MNRFNRFAALRWVYNIIVPPRYRDKLNITEELCALESAVNKVIEVTNNNGKALEAISQDLEDIQFGAGGYYRPAITENEDGSVTFSFVASDDSMPPIEEKTFFLGDMQTITEMLEGFTGEPMAVKNYIDEMSGGYYTPVFEQNGNTVEVSFLASNKMLPALDGYSFTLPSGPSGKSAYEVYKANGGSLSVDEWLASLKGNNGKSAYEIAVDNGFKGSVEDFFASLKGDTYALTPADKNEIAQAVIEILGGQPVFGYVDEDNNIKLNTGLDVGAYKLYYDDGNGNLIEVGSMTIEEVEDEPEPMTYTVTFMADGEVVAERTYTMNNPVVEEPTVPAKEGYTGAWADYDLSQGGDITVNAVYTAIGVEPAKPKNFFDASSGAVGRLSNSGVVRNDAQSFFVSNYIEVQTGDIVFVNGCNIASIISGTNTHFTSCYDSGKKHIASAQNKTSNNHFTFDSVTTSSAQITVKGDTVAYLRFTCGNPKSGTVVDTKSIVINIKRNDAWRTE